MINYIVICIGCLGVGLWRRLAGERSGCITGRQRYLLDSVVLMIFGTGSA
jgi:hypothetical protein